MASTGKELETYVGRGGCEAFLPGSDGVVALLGQQRPEQREQLQWPVRPPLCDGGAIKAADGGGYGARPASGAWERAH